MIKYTDEGLVLTDEDVIAASMFFGKWVSLQTEADCEEPEHWEDGTLLRLEENVPPFGITRDIDGGTEQLSGDKLCVAWPIVKAAIEPVEGEGYIRFYRMYPFAEIVVHQNYNGQMNCYHMRVLFLLKEPTRAELRELVERWEGV